MLSKALRECVSQSLFQKANEREYMGDIQDFEIFLTGWKKNANKSSASCLDAQKYVPSLKGPTNTG